MANFDSEFFGLVFPGFQATQKIHAQNSRPELSAFLSNFSFLNPKFIHGDFLLTGETNIFEALPRFSQRGQQGWQASLGPEPLCLQLKFTGLLVVIRRRFELLTLFLCSRLRVSQDRCATL